MILREPRYVFDTNVLIGALLYPDSTPGCAFAHAHEHGKILVSTPLLRELQAVLSRPKFEAYEGDSKPGSAPHRCDFGAAMLSWGRSRWSGGK